MSEMKEVRCLYCRHKHALGLEGKLEWYCPKCKKHQITINPANLPDNVDRTQDVVV